MASITEGALNLRRVVLLMVTMGVALLLASGVAHAAPANDDFANAQEITDLQLTRNYYNLWQLQATVRGTNVGATKEGGEPKPREQPRRDVGVVRVDPPGDWDHHDRHLQ